VAIVGDFAYLGVNRRRHPDSRRLNSIDLGDTHAARTGQKRDI
jgi:hypothetical protein